MNCQWTLNADDPASMCASVLADGVRSGSTTSVSRMEDGSFLVHGYVVGPGGRLVTGADGKTVECVHSTKDVKFEWSHEPCSGCEQFRKLLQEAA